MTWPPPELSDRDQAVLRDLRLVRLLTSHQIGRARFANFSSPTSQSSARRRSMRRLINLGLVTTLSRRVGGARAGSAGLIFSLDVAGQRLLDQLKPADAGRRRRPWPLGMLFVQHTLAVSELYVRLREADAAGQIELISFVTEPASWHQSMVGVLKPDGYAVYAVGELEQHCWIELDRGTESVPTLRRKLLDYLDEAQAGGVGPNGVMPQILISVDASLARNLAIRSLVASLPPPAQDLFIVQPFNDTFLSFGRPPP